MRFPDDVVATQKRQAECEKKLVQIQKNIPLHVQGNLELGIIEGYLLFSAYIAIKKNAYKISLKESKNQPLELDDINGNCLLLTFIIDHKGYLPMLNSEKIKFLKILLGDL